jgi:hypothetical protein
MNRPAVVATTLILYFQSSAAPGAVPEFGTREGELACAGLVELAYQGAQASKPSVPQVVLATAMAVGFYAGRLSEVDSKATKRDIDQALARLTLDEKNNYANACIKKAADLIGPQFADAR